MTNETLSQLVDRANGAEGPETLYLRPLTDTVVQARIWLRAPRPDDSSALPPHYRAYLIRDSAQHYVGIVVDHGEDLHWLVQPDAQGQGHLRRALQDVILPHLLQDRTEQRITISRNYGPEAFEASERVALRAGFKPVVPAEEHDEHVAIFRYVPAPGQALPQFSSRNTPIEELRLQRLRQQLAYHAACLQMISAEVSMHLGDDALAHYITDLADDVLGLGLQVEDASWAVEGQAKP
ncbi:GNAT family N-acetyltransferase [Hymenobacter jeollabukensis]|uniref:Uncharacterized protein n=1 Tax=Hymenobacter jeollabukensis TaxID=2025313 RepID=A0A5R8WK11_9BACT|nr:hypothetical protein [Hymenobacter jeollabukensis]TLM88812.1 hypothetical protein FDY95_23545 [Hymenobacter jeollabukensis]